MTLVVGYDGGESASAALDAAIALATALDEPLVVVCGVSPPGGLGEEYDALEEAVVEELSPVVVGKRFTSRIFFTYPQIEVVSSA